MQVLADEHGNTVYLGERECSIQRRHQKVLEEAPSPVVDAEMRRRMGEVAVRVAQAASYTNAGTIEFLVDEQKNFYFLEMNTRLQVEHPVTELMTGLDLVHLQIRIAAGERLAFRTGGREAARPRHRMPHLRRGSGQQFLPEPGKITLLLAPSGPGIRRDSGMYEGWTVPIDYDPLLAKLIGYGTDRAQATSRLVRALNEYFVGGIKTEHFSIPAHSAAIRTSPRDISIPATWTDCWLSRARTAPGRRTKRGSGSHRGRIVCSAGS